METKVILDTNILINAFRRDLESLRLKMKQFILLPLPIGETFTGFFPEKTKKYPFMDIQTRKILFVQEFLSIRSKETLSKFENLPNKEVRKRPVKDF